MGDWPRDVYPSDPKKARYLIRSNLDELVACGAIVRVGRQLVAVGAPFSSWLSRKGERVKGFSIAPNVRKVAEAVA